MILPAFGTVRIRTIEVLEGDSGRALWFKINHALQYRVHQSLGLEVYCDISTGANREPAHSRLAAQDVQKIAEQVRELIE